MNIIPDIKRIMVSMVGKMTRRRKDFQGNDIWGEIITK
jgi:hypothetical protein